MSTTAGDMVTDALERIGYRSAETPVENDDMMLGIRRLNRMMQSWESIVALGYTPVSAPTDAITVPDDALDAIETALALKLINDFDMPEKPGLRAEAAKSYSLMLVANKMPIAAQFPSTLPAGSGNAADARRDSDYYSNDGGSNF